MINFRELFNVSYGYWLLGIVLVLLLVLVLIKRDLIACFRSVGTILFISGILCLVVSFVCRFGVLLFVDSSYRVFVRIISDNLCSSLLYRGIIEMLVGGGLWVVYYYLVRKKTSYS